MESLGKMSAEVLDREGISLHALVEQKQVPEELLKYLHKHPIFTIWMFWDGGGERWISVNHEGSWYNVAQNYKYCTSSAIENPPIVKFRTPEHTSQYLYTVCMNIINKSTTYEIGLFSNDILKYEEPETKSVPDHHAEYPFAESIQVHAEWFKRRKAWTKGIITIRSRKVVNEEEDDDEYFEPTPVLTQEMIENMLEIQTHMYL